MILVTGAAGKTGRAVLAALAKQGSQTRGLVRRPEQREGLTANEVVVGDMQDPKAIERALDGIDALYLICPNVHPAELEIAHLWIAAAQRNKLERFVYHSVLYPQLEAMPHHWKKLRAEEALIQSGLNFTILQPAIYMQNVIPSFEVIKRSGVYKVPYSVDASFSMVDLQDVAEVAAVTLRLRQSQKYSSVLSHSNFQLCGPGNLTSVEIAERLSEHFNRPVTAESVSLKEWQMEAKNKGMSPYAVDSLSKMFGYYDKHGLEGRSWVLHSLLKRIPTTYSEFLEREAK